jgi:hypothetical protein
MLAMPIDIFPYNPEWKEWFNDLYELIFEKVIML